MNIKAILSLLVFVAAMQSQQTNSQTPEQEHAAMMKRGDAGMGFSQEQTTHHFILLKDGGAIQVGVNDPKDEASRDHVRMHLSHVTEMFSKGDFNVPMFIHNTTPPGVSTMTKLHNEIHYRYQETDAGGRIMIDTRNPKALVAVHEFLRFQITEHKTGDPTEVPNDAVKR